MPKITPFLWLNNQAEEAARYYTSIFKNSRIGTITRYVDGMPLPKGTVMTITFFLDGQEFTVLNGGPEFQFNESISFYVHCETQEEVDEYWEKLSAGGEKGPCGWLKDKYGVSWQIVPTALDEMLTDPDPVRVRRVTDVMLKMGKLEIVPLKQAYESK